VPTRWFFIQSFAHGSLLVAWALTAFWLVTADAQIDIRSYVNGLNFCSLKTTVRAFGVVIWLVFEIVSIFISEPRYEAGSSIPRTNENLTSAAVIGVPSENCTPGRRVNVSVFFLLSSLHAFASRPLYDPVRPNVVVAYLPATVFRSSNVSTRFARTSLSPSVPNCWKS